MNGIKQALIGFISTLVALTLLIVFLHRLSFDSGVVQIGQVVHDRSCGQPGS